MSQDADVSPPPPPIEPVALGPLAARGALGGVMMGLANLVPGISGGTMLLAAGIYPRFVVAIAEVTTFRFRLPSLVVLASVVGTGAVAILLLAGVVKELVLDHRWVMYSLFIGLTLGGVPVLWRMIGRPTPSVWIGCGAGLGVMAVIAWMQQLGAGAADGEGGGFVVMLLAGLLAASAMILPGISGGYLLLVMGQYVPILAGIDEFKDALRAMDLARAMAPLLRVIVPVGLGVAGGVAAVSHLLRWLLARFEKAMLGVLLGFLLGAVLGLWPFRASVAPQVGEVIKGRAMTSELIARLKPQDYPTEYFTPTAGQVAAALALIAAGFAITLLVARLGRGREA